MKRRGGHMQTLQIQQRDLQIQLKSAQKDTMRIKAKKIKQHWMT